MKGIVLVLFVAVLSAVNVKLGIRAIGIVECVWATNIAIRQYVGVGIEGFEPWYVVKGVPALLVGIAGIVLGILILVNPDFLLN